MTASPFVMCSRTLDFGFSQERIWICINLMDHACVGVGLSQKEAMDSMLKETAAKNAPPEGPSFTK